MKIRVPDNAPVRVLFREERLGPVSDSVKVLSISASDADIEVPGAETHFRIGMKLKGTELQFPGAGVCVLQGLVKAVSGNRCNLVFERIEPEKPLLDYLQQQENLEKMSQKTYKPAGDIGKVLFAKFMDDQKKPKGTAKKKVLIVDDAISVHQRFRAAFLEDGFEVLQAVDGMEGVKKALESQPDIILMDINMPKMSGIEATRIIRSNPRTGSIPICMFTTEGEQDFIVQTLRTGVRDYILKTADAAAVIARVRRIIGG